MSNPEKISVKVTLEDGKELAISLDCPSWEEVEKYAPWHAILFEDWAKDGQ